MKNDIFLHLSPLEGSGVNSPTSKVQREEKEAWEGQNSTALHVPFTSSVDEVLTFLKSNGAILEGGKGRMERKEF